MDGKINNDELSLYYIINAMYRVTLYNNNNRVDGYWIVYQAPIIEDNSKIGNNGVEYYWYRSLNRFFYSYVYISNISIERTEFNTRTVENTLLELI